MWNLNLNLNYLKCDCNPEHKDVANKWNKVGDVPVPGIGYKGM